MNFSLRGTKIHPKKPAFLCAGFSKSFKVVGGGSGGPPTENLEILDGRRCNLGIYLRKIVTVFLNQCNL
jgi:hypothetical protein